MVRKGIAVVLVLLCIAFSASCEEYWMPKRSREAFRILVEDLVQAVESPDPEDVEQIQRDLEVIRGIREADYVIARAVAEHWEKVYLNPYSLILDQEEGAVERLRETGVSDSDMHAFVVLGYALQNGGMTDELKGRCRAAAVAAQAFPSAILVCSGGATGSNNPKNHTEAGLMREYLISEFGIDPGRIFIDEQAMTTVENAVYTFRILREKQIRSLTLVTSDYHQKWGQVVYNLMAAISGQEYDYCPELVGNFCFETSGKHGPSDARAAAGQVTRMLGLSKKQTGK
ncbi:MAG: YdcF family protein [Clostridia bacterium]|nr:YdcF family protein [Clostridia bacterium]